MDIQHRHIEVFRAVMTAGSVTAAAALLHTSQPTLSRDLARLEQLLGYALFERERGRLKATARARALFDEVERSFQCLARVIERAEALGRAEDTALSVLSLPALSHALLPRALSALLAEHPRRQRLHHARRAATAGRLASSQLAPLFDEHIRLQRQRTDSALAACNFDTLAIHAAVRTWCSSTINRTCSSRIRISSYGCPSKTLSIAGSCIGPAKSRG